MRYNSFEPNGLGKEFEEEVRKLCVRVLELSLRFTLESKAKQARYFSGLLESFYATLEEIEDLREGED